MDKLDVKYATYAKALPPQPIRLRKPGWGGTPDRMEDGSEPQPWHCLPFVEAATHGLELVYPFENECHVVNDGGVLRFEWDFAAEPGGEASGGEFIAFEPKRASRWYIFNTRVDLQAPPGHVVRTEPHPRFFTDDTGTVPAAVCGHVQTEWWPRRFFVVFKAPAPGQRHVFRKGEPYVQLLFVPQRVAVEPVKMSTEEEARRRELEIAVDTARASLSENTWHNPAGVTFSDHYKVLARAFARDGAAGVDEVMRAATEKHKASLPSDKPVAEILATGREAIAQRRYDQAKALYQHVLSRDPANAEALSQLGVVAACIGRPREGLQMMARAIELQPNVPALHNNRGELLRLLGRLPEAEQEFRASLGLYPDDAAIHSLLGLTVAQQGRVAEGLEICRAALALGRQTPMVHVRIGMIHTHQKDYASARASYEAALSVDPNFIHARRALQDLPAIT